MNALLLIAVAAVADAPKPLIVRSLNDGSGVEVAAQLPAKLANRLPEGKLKADAGEKLLRFCLVNPATGKPGAAMLGSYERRGATLLFRPRYPLLAGQRYRATFTGGTSAFAVIEHEVPAATESVETVVEKIYPTSDELPANLLKFYIYFSRPMRESRDIFDSIDLRDDKGKLVVDPWRRTELWSKDAKRLTLWVHPGRVKEGVNLREDLGPVLEPGKKYTLVITRELRDATGKPLGMEIKRTFRVTAPLRTRLSMDDWQLMSPPAGTTSPLRVTFPRPLDHALLARFLTLLDASGKEVSGRSEVSAGETTWSFHPAEPWATGKHTLKVDQRLEDLAGNTLERVFDLDLKAPRVTAPRLTREFTPGP